MATQNQDLEIIESLARDWNRPVEEVKALYDIEFSQLREGARITDYLPLFASRRTAERLASLRR